MRPPLLLSRAASIAVLFITAASAIVSGFCRERISPIVFNDITQGESRTVKISAQVVRTLAFGFRVILADYAWLDAIQYYGTAANENDRFVGLFDKLDLSTDLDPAFEYAYQFGGEAIPYHDAPTNLWHNVGKAIALLKKGAGEKGLRWEVPWLLGYTLSTYRGQYAEAGAAMMRAADLIDSEGQRSDAPLKPPTYIRSLATKLLAQGGDLSSAILSTQLRLDTSTDDRAQSELTERLNALTLQQRMEQLTELASQFRKGPTLNASIRNLRSQKDSIAFEDPFGGSLWLDSDGQARSAHEDRLLRIHLHPGEPAIEPTAD